jgi:DNA recombination protein RmuC
VGFVEDLEQIGKRLDQAQSSYHDAFSKLKSGKGNLIKAAEKVKELGVKPSKSITNHLIHDD